MSDRRILLALRATLVINAVLSYNLVATMCAPVHSWTDNVDPNAQVEFRVTGVGTKADAYENLGPCPITVGFGAWITSNGPGTATPSSAATGRTAANRL